MSREEYRSIKVELQHNGIIRNSEGIALGRLEKECVTDMGVKRLIQNQHVKKLIDALEFINANPNCGIYDDGSSEDRAAQALTEWAAANDRIGKGL